MKCGSVERVRARIRRLAAGLCLTLPLLWAPLASAADLVLALDRSGSMQVYDPRHDSVRGVELFVALLAADDRLGFMSFAETGERRLPLTPLRDATIRDRIVAQARQIPMTGALTNFEEALRLAYELQTATPSAPGTERALIIFTDGQIDLGTQAANQASQERIQATWLPKFQAAGIRIHGVAFSPWSDLDLLRRMAEVTGGQAFRAERPEDIQDAFVRLFETAKQPLAAPIVNGKVKVDASVNELRLLVKRDAPDEKIRLTTPLGKTLTLENAGPDVEWTSTPNFDHVTIRQPEAGAWTVVGSNGEKQAWIASDLDLYVLLPPAAQAGRRLPLTVQLINGSGARPDPALFKEVRFAATVLDERESVVRELTLEPFYTDDRVQEVRGDLRIDNPGHYRVRVTATSPLFTRAKDSFITVGTAPPAAPAPTSAAAPAAPLPPPPPVADPAPAASPMPGPAPESAPSASPQPALSREEQIRQTAIALFVGFNLVLLTLLGGFLGVRWWLRRRRSPTAQDD